MKHTERIAWGIFVLTLIVWGVPGRGGPDRREDTGSAGEVVAGGSPRFRENHPQPEGTGERPVVTDLAAGSQFAPGVSAAAA